MSQDRRHRHRLRRPHHGRLLRPPRPRGRLRRRRRRQGRRCSSGARSRSSRRGSTTSCARGIDGGRLSLRARRAPTPSPTASSPTSACRPRRAPTARPTCPTSRRRPARSARSCRSEAIVVNKSTVPVGSTRVVERALGRSDVRGRVEPRVPPRGLGDPRLPQPRPHRDRRRGPGRRRAGGVALPRASPRRSSSPTRRRPRRSSTPPTRSSPRRSPSSTPSPPCARRSAPTSRTSPSAWATTRRIGHEFLQARARAGAAAASRRTRGR